MACRPSAISETRLRPEDLRLWWGGRDRSPPPFVFFRYIRLFVYSSIRPRASSSFVNRYIPLPSPSSTQLNPNPPPLPQSNILPAHLNLAAFLCIHQFVSLIVCVSMSPLTFPPFFFSLSLDLGLLLVHCLASPWPPGLVVLSSLFSPAPCPSAPLLSFLL